MTQEDANRRALWVSAALSDCLSGQEASCDTFMRQQADRRSAMLVSSGYAEHVCVHGELRASWRCLCVQQQPLTCDVTPCTVAMASTMRLQPAALLCISCDLCKKGSAFIVCGVMQNVWWLSSSRSLMRLLLACSHGSAVERDFRSATHSGGATCEEQARHFSSTLSKRATGLLRPAPAACCQGLA